MSDIIQAWASGVRLLSRARPFVILEIDDLSVSEREIRPLSDALGALGLERPTSVASVLMPKAVVDSTLPLEDALMRGVELFGRHRRKSSRPLSGWAHTYFERLVGRCGLANGATKELGLNHILHIVEKMNRWENDVHAGLYAHTNLPGDRLRVRGAPCLQYLQIELHDSDSFTLNALYRSHDYGNKCLGNLLGLSRLGHLFASNCDRNFARLRVISLNPFLPPGKRKQLEELADGFVQPE